MTGTMSEYTIEVTTRRTYRADAAELRATFADDLREDHMETAEDIEIIEHIYDQSGVDNFQLVDEDIEDFEIRAVTAA